MNTNGQKGLQSHICRYLRKSKSGRDLKNFHGGFVESLTHIKEKIECHVFIDIFVIQKGEFLRELVGTSMRRVNETVDEHTR